MSTRRPPDPSVMRSTVRSVPVTYFLWLLFGQFGLHKLYLGRVLVGVGYMSLGALGWAAAWFLVGLMFLIPLWILLLIDLFTIPFQVRRANVGLFR